MATDLGTDINCVTGMDSHMRLVSGNINLGNALARRLITPRGSLIYDPDYGFDTRQFLNAGSTQAQLFTIQSTVERECEKDPRVAQVSAAVTFNLQTATMSINLTGSSNAGPFALVIVISQLSVAVLNANG